MTVLGVIMIFFNSKFFLKIRHRVKITIFCFLFFTAYALNYISYQIEDNTLGFAVACSSALLIGGGAVLSDTTCLGFLKTFPSQSVGAYSSGTGFSGLIGVSISLAADWMEIDYRYVSKSLIDYKRWVLWKEFLPLFI